MKSPNLKQNKFIFCFFFIVLFSVSCGYRLSSLSTRYHSIEIPYIAGDKTGALTSQVVEAISSKTQLKYVPEKGDLILKLKVVSLENEHIGFQYDVKKDGNFINRLVPNEARAIMKVQVVLEDSHTGEDVMAPFEITTDSDYDFVNSDTYTDLAFSDRNKETVSVLSFSLGQLNSWQEASEASLAVLYRKLSENIAEALLRL